MPVHACQEKKKHGRAIVKCFKELGHKGAHEGQLRERGHYMGTITW